MMQAPTLFDTLILLGENIRDMYRQVLHPDPDIPLRLTSGDAFTRLFHSYCNHIHDPSLLADSTQDLRRSLGLWHLNRERRFLRIITKVEQLICSLTPPIVDHPYTVSQLRAAVLASGTPRDCGEAIQFLFLPRVDQQLFLYDLGLRSSVRYLSQIAHGSDVQLLIKEQVAGSLLSAIRIDRDRIIMPAETIRELLAAAPAQRTGAFRLLYRLCYDHIRTTVGEKVAQQLLVQPYSFIHTSYDSDLSHDLFTILPLEVTETILLTVLTRQELESKVTQATQEERKRRELAEQLAGELEQSKYELQREKATVDEKIRQRTQELAREKDRLDASISNLPVGFIMTDEAQKLVYLNTAARRILSLESVPPSIELVSQQLRQCINLPVAISHCLKNQEIISPPTLALEQRFLSMKISPIISSTTQDMPASAIGTVILLEDVTEAKILERAKEEFFAIASHELRTPLTIIRWNIDILTEMLDGVPGIPEKAPHLIHGVADAGGKLLDIINDFLDVSRLEQHRIQFRTHPVNMTEAVTAVHHELTPLAQQKHLELAIHADPNLPMAQADDNRLRQVLVNLISNAVKNTQNGMIITSIRQHQDLLEIRVSDTGSGIPAENQSLLFRKFQLAQENFLTREASRSTGLGLYICKLLVEGMGGTIQLEHSLPGQGSTFLFTVPVAITVEPQPKAPLPPPLSATSAAPALSL